MCEYQTFGVRWGVGGVFLFFELADFLEHSAEPVPESNLIFLRYKRTWPSVPLGPKIS